MMRRCSISSDFVLFVFQATVWKALGEEVVKELKTGKAN
jgi:hypothetical protein